MFNNYEEVKSFLPDYYDEFVETQAYLKALGYHLDLAEESNQRVLLNNFINLADAQTIERLERYLYLPVDRAKPLEDRKRLVASFFVGFGKMSATKIKEIVYQFTNATPDVEFKDSTIFVEIERGTTQSLYLVDVATVLSRRLPAHLGFTLSVKITVETTIGARTKVYPFDYKLCNMLICGTYPRYAYIGSLDERKTEVSLFQTIQEFDYKLCGTFPNEATLGQLDVFSSEINVNDDDYLFNYQLAGTKPYTSTLGNISAVTTEADKENQSVSFSYVPCGTKRCGQ